MRLPFIILLQFVFLHFYDFAQIHIIGGNNPSPYSKHAFELNGAINPFVKIIDFKNNSSYYKHNFDWGANIGYVFSKSLRYGYGIEYGFEFSKLNFNTSINTTTRSLLSLDDLTIEHEGMSLFTHRIVPKLEWKWASPTNSIQYIHQIGLGLTISSVKEMDYNFELIRKDSTTKDFIEMQNFVDGNDAENSFDINQFYNHRNKVYMGGSLLYAFSVRGEITKSILWTVGIRTQFNFSGYTFKNYEFQYEFEDSKYWVTRRDMKYIINKNRERSIAFLQVGLIFKLLKKNGISEK